MESLTAHLLEDGDHGRLGFHPGCPVCRRERLFGLLRAQPVVSRRVKALLATSALAVSTAAPGFAVAGEPDRQQEGFAAPGPSADVAPEPEPGGGAADDPTFDPGGQTALPLEGGTPDATSPNDPASDFAAPVEPAEPVHDPYAGVLLPTQPESGLPAENAPVPPVEAPPVEPAPPSPDPTTVDSPPVDVEAPAQGPLDTTDSPPHPDSSTTPGTDDGRNQKSGRDRSPRPDERAAPKAETNAPSPQPAPQVPTSNVAPAVGVTTAPGASPVAPRSSDPNAVATSSRSVRVEADTSTRGATNLPPHARFHVVQPGESLWSIAKKLLGPTATTAQLAREVDRLWELNKDRIGTGSPDLLIVGAKLRLR